MDMNQMTENMKQFMADWQKRMEEMQAQFSSGKLDAMDAFEKQKEQYRDALVKVKENLDKATEIGEEKLTELKTKLEELRLQLALGKADGMDAFEEQKKKIELAMHEFYILVKSNFNSSFLKGLELYDQQADAFKTSLEIIKLQFSLARMDARDEMAEKQKEIGEKMIELNQQFQQIQSTAFKNMEEMNAQLRENFEKMKAYAEGWMKKS
ncbi:MAG: hypothetical protein MH472_08545 [Bacteroidia bacterium]|nr:hypothetical protein [Bacteroidia bacterium]